jgi:hypothetical protein
MRLNIITPNVLLFNWSGFLVIYIEKVFLEKLCAGTVVVSITFCHPLIPSAFDAVDFKSPSRSEGEDRASSTPDHHLN